MLLCCNIDGALTEVQNSTHRANNSNVNPFKCLGGVYYKPGKITYTHTYIHTLSMEVETLFLGMLV